MDISFASIDYDRKPAQIELFIEKPNRETIGKIKHFYNHNLKAKLGNISELSFTISYDEDKENVEKIRQRYFLKAKLNNVSERFIITDLIRANSNNIDELNVVAFSLPYELNDKLISNYSVTSYKIDEIANDLLSSTVWSVGYIDPYFLEKYRSFEVSASTTVLDCIFKLAETFQALIVWDTDNCRINFYRNENIGSNKGLRIKYGKYLKSLNNNETSTEMVTVLNVSGRNGTDIRSVNPTGTSTIEDFSYFMYPFEMDGQGNVIKHSHYLSDELCIALFNYKALVESKTGVFNNLANQKRSLQNTLTELENELFNLNVELAQILDLLDVKKAADEDVTDLVAQKNSKEAEINGKQSEINNIKSQIDDIDDGVGQLRDELALENNFTPEQIVERNRFVIQKEYHNEYCEDPLELYELATKHFEQLRKPKSVITIDIDNFLEVVEAQYDWDKLNLGDIITIVHENMNVNVEAKIIEIDYNFEPGEIKLTIADTVDILDDESKFYKELYGKAISTSATVDMEKFKWDRISDVESDFYKYITGELDAVKQQILAGVNNSVSMSGRGLIITDPSDPLKKIICQAGVIALSLDGGNNWQTAILPTGVMADRLIGRIILGSQLTITNASGEFVFNENGLSIKNTSITVIDGITDDQIQSAQTWHSKETPQGAQDKADAAKNEAIRYADENTVHKVEIFSTGGLVFKNGQISTTLIARVYKGKEDITDQIDANYFRWTRISDDPAADEIWNAQHYGGAKQITITQDDVSVRATFNCEILNYMEGY